MAQTELSVPGRGRGLVDVFSQRYLLKLLVRKELRVRYRGSVLGMAWSYVKPATQFIVFYFAMGVFLKVGRDIEYFAVYLFSGIVVINFFSEAFGNATRTLIWNAHLIKKIYLPRELFPVSAIYVSVVHFLPQLVVLLVGALAVGWRPTLLGVLAALLGFLLTAILGLGLGMLFGSVNVFFRDAENFVDLLLLVATWASPVLYSFAMVKDAFSDHPWLITVYELNPITVAVQLFHYAFWVPVGGPDAMSQMPDSMVQTTVTGFLVALVVLLLGQTVFRRLEGRFAQEL